MSIIVIIEHEESHRRILQRVIQECLDKYSSPGWRIEALESMVNFTEMLEGVDLDEVCCIITRPDPGENLLEFLNHVRKKIPVAIISGGMLDPVRKHLESLGAKVFKRPSTAEMMLPILQGTGILS